MKAITLALTFTAVVAAQRPASPDPEVELAVPIAFELQEHDLAKAEKAYREAIASGKLSVEGRQVAHMRLSRMLRTLGRGKEADALMETLMRETPVATLDDVTGEPQDAEREAALRKQAEDVVAALAKARDLNLPTRDSPLRFFPADPSKQLLWIGQAAVPVVIARLEAFTKADAFDPDVTSGLAGFLWRVGGPKSRQFFDDAVRNAAPAWRANWVRTAFQASDDMLATAALFLRDPDEAVFENLLTSPPWPTPGVDTKELRYRLPQADIVDAALGVDDDARKAWVLQWATNCVLLEPGPRDRLVAFVSGNLVRSSRIGVAAQDFVLSQNAQRSIAGLELLLRELPRLAASGREPQSRAVPGVFPGHRGVVAPPPGFSRDEALRLLPAAERAATETSLEANGVRNWFTLLLRDIATPLDDAVVPHALAWMRLGLADSEVLRGRITAANYRDVVALLPQLPVAEVARLVDVLVASPVDPPPDLSGALRAAADAANEAMRSGAPRPSPRPSPTPPAAYEAWLAPVRAAFLQLVARTGDPGAAPWLLANDAARELLDLGRRSTDERVREAMRALVERARADLPRDTATKNLLLLALLAMHDVPSLESLPLRLTDSADAQRHQHPLRTREDAPLLTPLQYLVYRDADPPHGFTDEDVIGVLRKIAARRIPQDWEPKFWTVGLISDRVLAEIARLVALGGAPSGGGYEWMWEVQARLRERAGKNEPLGPLGDWHAQMLATPAAPMVLTYVDEANAARLRPQIERLVDSEDGQTALQATNAIERHFHVKTIEWAKRLIGNRERLVRDEGLKIAAELRGEEGEALALQMTEDPSELRGDAAAALGAMVSVKAVPRLVELLRDPESYVREKAAEALTRIRFYHEQQAHWDRVLKGLDASPASAAEKLLLQAKPGAPKAQRLLAIKSLGALGVPEALPFLIDWSAETDAEVASAAQAAITAIHLNPRR